MHDVWLIGDWDDIETSLLEDIENGEFEMTTRAMKPRTRKPIVCVQVITVICPPCEEVCENLDVSRPSTMINIGDYHDGNVEAKCPNCGEVYTISADVFSKTLRNK